MVDARGVSTTFFLLQGATYFLIGGLTPFLIGMSDGMGILFFSHRSDSGYFGSDTHELMRQDPNLVRLRDLFFLGLAGLLVALGAVVMALAWWGVGRGETWAYGTLMATGALAAAFWVLLIVRYTGGGASVGLGDIPPFMWVTTAFWVGGSIAGLADRFGPAVPGA